MKRLVKAFFNAYTNNKLQGEKSMPKLQGFSWHIGYGSTNNPQKRNRNRCIYHARPDMCIYKQSYRICNGPSKCQIYAESYKTVDNSTIIDDSTDNNNQVIFSYGKKKVVKQNPHNILGNKSKQPIIISHPFYGKMKMIKQTSKSITFITALKKEVSFKRTVYNDLIKIGTIEVLS